jgi:acyl-CoA thioesterase-1
MNLFTKAAKGNCRRSRVSGLTAAALGLLLLIPPASSGADAGTGPDTSTNNILVLGDSLAAGLGVAPGQAFPAVLQEKLDDAGLKDRVINAGVSGDTSADGLGRIDWLMKRPVGVLILELGANDGLRGLPVSMTRSNLQAIVSCVRSKYPEAKVVIAGMEMPPNMGEDYTTEFRKIFPELARTNGAALIPFLLEGVAGNPELNQEDRMHPNAAGHRIVAENVWKVLKPLLRERNPPAR